MFTEPLDIYDACIRSLHVRWKEGKPIVRLKVACTMTKELAKALGVHDTIFNSKGLRRSFTEVSLETGCKAFSAHFAVDGLPNGAVMVQGDDVSEMHVYLRDGGKLELVMRMSFHGSPQHVVSYGDQVGEAEAHLELKPLEVQEVLPLSEPAQKVMAAGGAREAIQAVHRKRREAQANV